MNPSLSRRRALALMLAAPTAAQAQGFANLGTGGEGFALPERGRVLAFPADHGPHPEFRIEWWYLTANLTDATGRPCGIQWTLFRTALAPGEGEGWSSPQLWMGHAAVTLPDRHLVAERLARGGVGQAGVVADPFAAWIDDWRMEGPTMDTLRLTASGADFTYDLDLRAEGPLVLHGDAGYSVKSAEGQASHYYSQPYYSVSGQITLSDEVLEVTGNAWLDREWSSQPLAADQTGWDWFSLSLDTGDKLMGFVLRGTADFTAATWIGPGGVATPYPDGALTARPLATHDTAKGPVVPVSWQVTLPDRGLDVTVTALNPEAWITVSVPYWEGPVTIAGTHPGRGYLEMTGYE